MALFRKKEESYPFYLDDIMYDSWPQFRDYCPKPDPLKRKLHPAKYEKKLLSECWDAFFDAVDKCYYEKLKQIDDRYAEFMRIHGRKEAFVICARNDMSAAKDYCRGVWFNYWEKKDQAKHAAPLVKEYTQAVRKLSMSKSLDLIESSLIVNIAERLLPAIHQEAMAASRESHVEIIRALMELEVRKDQLILRSTDKEKENFKSLVVFDFERERCPMPATVMDYSAIGRAVGHCAAVLYMEQHPKDPCGTPCVIHMKNEIYGCYRDTKTGEDIEYVIYPLQYAAKNKGFQQVKQW